MPKQIMPNSFMLDTELGDYIVSHTFLKQRLIMYPEQGCAMPENFVNLEEDILNFDVLPDDIWVVSYPKCGTTWTQEMVWLIANGLDYEGAKQDLTLRFPFMEHCALKKKSGSELAYDGDGLNTVKNQKNPRFIKSHLPVGLLPRKLWEVKPKIIYVMREPKDVAISYYNHYLLRGYTGTKDRFLEGFISNQIIFGSYWGNVSSFWNIRHLPNVLINTFEDMKNDLSSVIRRTAKFLEKDVPEEDMKKLLDHLQFSKMKNNKFVNMENFFGDVKQIHGVNKDKQFMNKGIVGNYKTKMPPEWIQRLDDWKRQEKIKYGFNKIIEFPY